MAASGSRLMVLACCASLLLLPSVSAKPVHSFPISGEVDNLGTVTLTGTLRGQADVAAIVFSSNWGNGAVQAHLNATGVRVQILNDELVYLRNTPASPFDKLDAPAPLPEQVVEDFNFNGPISIRSEQAEASIQFLSQGPQGTSLNVTGPQSIEVPQIEQYVVHATYPNQLPSAGRLQRQDAGTQTSTGTYEALIYGANVTLGTGPGARTIHTGRYPHQGVETTDPMGYYKAGYYDQFTVKLSIPRATLQLDQAHGGLWNTLVTKFAGSYQGDIAFVDVTATTVDPRYHDQRLGLVQAIGDFNLDGAYDATHSHWHVDGTATFLGIDGIPVFGARTLLEAALVVSTSLSIIAWLALVLTRFGKDLRFLLWGHNKQAQPLGHPTRLRLLEIISQEPGIAASQLMSRLGIRRPSLAFHARILEHAGHIKSYRHGNREHFTPAAGASASVSSVIQQSVRACLAHPVRARILNCFVNAGTQLGYDTLIQALAQSEHAPGRTLVSYHLRLMEREGVLVRTQAKRPVQWTLASQTGTQKTLQAVPGMHNGFVASDAFGPTAIRHGQTTASTGETSRGH